MEPTQDAVKGQIVLAPGSTRYPATGPLEAKPGEDVQSFVVRCLEGSKVPAKASRKYFTISGPFPGDTPVSQLFSQQADLIFAPPSTDKVGPEADAADDGTEGPNTSKVGYWLEG